jgi:hypothetical protein
MTQECVLLHCEICPGLYTQGFTGVGAGVGALVGLGVGLCKCLFHA